MLLIKPSYRILTPATQIDKVLEHLEAAGRTCYKSEAKITGNSAQKFIKKIIQSGHHSVLEHESLTVRFIVNRGFTHELVRHRLCAYSQESTRYCDYSKDSAGDHIQFIIPPCFYSLGLNRIEVRSHDGLDGLIASCGLRSDISCCVWMHAILNCEIAYKRLRKEGLPPQTARGVLPIDLKTEIVHTANMREWRHIFSLRATKAAHPQMSEQMDELLCDMKNRIPVLFDDLHPSNEGETLRRNIQALSQ